MSTKNETIRSSLWHEVPEGDNPFAASVCYCSGYDVFGEILTKASWFEYLYLLFTGERPSEQQTKLLEGLAIALANPGLRDHSVRAAMNGGVGGATNAASLMAALAVGAGELGGGREIVIAIRYWEDCGHDIDIWKRYLQQAPKEERADIWVPMEHSPGFDPHGTRCPKPVKQALDYLSEISPGRSMLWLKQNRESLEKEAGYPLAMSGVAAAALFDLGFNADQAEMLYLFLRLPGAAVHSLEQKALGWRHYPFFHDAIVLTNDPEVKDTKQAK